MVLHPTSQIRDWKAPRGILATTKRFVCWAVKWDVITSNVVSPSLDHSIGHSLYPERVPSRFNMTQKATCPQPFRTRAYREDPYPSISYDLGTRNITPKSHSSERLCAFTKEQWEIFEKAFNLIPRETKIYLVPATIPSVDLLWSVEIDLLSTRQQLGVERLFELHAQPTGTFAQKYAEEIAGEFDIYVDDTYVEIDYEAGYEDY